MKFAVQRAAGHLLSKPTTLTGLPQRLGSDGVVPAGCWTSTDANGDR